MSSSQTPETKAAILTRTPPRWQNNNWQQALATAISDPAELLERLQLPAEWLPAARRAAAGFPLRVPRYFAGLMRPGDPADPLLRQVLPLAEELAEVPGYVADPVGDLAAKAATGLLHKYRGRALLITTGACAVHCRYCFRRHFPYSEEQAGRDQWAGVLEQLAGMKDIDEVILSGGDPLTLSDPRLAPLIEGLGEIGHLRRLRLHTRLPIVLPERLTAELTAMLSASRLAASLVLHANHPNELTGTLGEALAPLRRAGIALLNQTVLLAGINDRADTLAELSEQLFDLGVLPYYLHQLDPVSGAAHFQVSDDVARRLHTTLRDRLPGYLLPRLVCEKPGAPAKLPL
jgi:EF-P beta-lysylation protein EpmB